MFFPGSHFTFSLSALPTGFTSSELQCVYAMLLPFLLIICMHFCCWSVAVLYVLYKAAVMGVVMMVKKYPLLLVIPTFAIQPAISLMFLSSLFFTQNFENGALYIFSCFIIPF